jgi:hypothetical protein
MFGDLHMHLFQQALRGKTARYPRGKTTHAQSCPAVNVSTNIAATDFSFQSYQCKLFKLQATSAITIVVKEKLIFRFPR